MMPAWKRLRLRVEAAAASLDGEGPTEQSLARKLRDAFAHVEQGLTGEGLFEAMQPESPLLFSELPAEDQARYTAAAEILRGDLPAAPRAVAE